MVQKLFFNIRKDGQIELGIDMANAKLMIPMSPEALKDIDYWICDSGTCAESVIDIVHDKV